MFGRRTSTNVPGATAKRSSGADSRELSRAEPLALASDDVPHEVSTGVTVSQHVKLAIKFGRRGCLKPPKLSSGATDKIHCGRSDAHKMVNENLPCKCGDP